MSYTLRRRRFPQLVRKHQCPLEVGPGVADELAGYFKGRPELRAHEVAEHGADPLQDPGCYLAAEQQEGYHRSLHDLTQVGLDDVKEWEREEDAYHHVARLAKEQPAAGDVHVDTADGEFGQQTQRKKRKPKGGDVEVTVAKVDEAQRLVYGVVLEPDVEDTQGDVVSKEDVEAAAHRYLYGRNPIGDQHLRAAPGTVRPVESYIAPCDFQMGSQTVRKGSWVLVGKVADDDLWQQVLKGEKGGWSVGGTGRRSPL